MILVFFFRVYANYWFNYVHRAMLCGGSGAAALPRDPRPRQMSALVVPVIARSYEVVNKWRLIIIYERTIHQCATRRKPSEKQYLRQRDEIKKHLVVLFRSRSLLRRLRGDKIFVFIIAEAPEST